MAMMMGMVFCLLSWHLFIKGFMQMYQTNLDTEDLELKTDIFFKICTVAVYSWSMAFNFVTGSTVD